MIEALAIASFGWFMVTFDGQKQSLKEQLVGTWTLLAWEQKKGDGTKLERYGTSPKGIAFFDAGGRYIITVMRSDRARYASNALWQGTAEENKETADSTTTYFGTYSISEADSGIAIHIEGSSFPNWNDTDQKRSVTITEDSLTLTVHPPGGDVVDVIWKRAMNANVPSRHHRRRAAFASTHHRPPHRSRNPFDIECHHFGWHHRAVNIHLTGWAEHRSSPNQPRRTLRCIESRHRLHPVTASCVLMVDHIGRGIYQAQSRPALPPNVRQALADKGIASSTVNSTILDGGIHQVQPPFGHRTPNDYVVAVGVWQTINAVVVGA